MTAAFQLMLNSCQSTIEAAAHRYTYTHTQSPHFLLYVHAAKLFIDISSFSFSFPLSLSLCLLNLNAPRPLPHMRLVGDVYVSLGAEMGYIYTRYMYLSPSPYLPPFPLRPNYISRAFLSVRTLPYASYAPCSKKKLGKIF